MRCTLRVVSLVLAAIGPCATALPAQDSVPAVAPRPVFLTVSGGISKGSHQAGVNWALLRAIRRSADPAFRTRHALAADGFTLGGMTGASAGNINSVLTALEWCRAAEESDPRQSLFWRHWIPAGFTDLVPEQDGGAAMRGGGLVDRTRFRASHLPQLRAFAAGEEATLRDCAVPIGITVTRRGLDSARVFDALYIPMTRYAITFEVRTARTADGAYATRFFPFAPDSQIGHFGERLWPVPLDSAAGYPMETIFDIVSASAAFPIAFAPERLRYVKDAGCLFTGCLPDSAFFLDGGVFDNNPVDLTIGIRRRVVPHGRSLTVYIDPDHRRSRVVDDSVVIQDGLAGLVPTVHAFVQSGRAAEIYAVAKAEDLDSALFDMAAHPLMRTDRAFTIAGAELGGFGAFLGRPLRAFDFYVGMYDGLVFVAMHMGGMPQANAGMREDIGRRVRALLEDESVIAFADDRAFLLRLWAAEFGGTAPDAPHGRARTYATPQGTPVAFAGPNGFDGQVLRTLLDGSLAAMRGVPPPCRGLGILGTFYCGTNLPSLIAAVRRDRDLMMQVDAAADATLVDEDFARFVRAPQERLHVLANRLIARLYESERALGSPQWAQAASVAGLYLNQAHLGEPRSVFRPRDLLGAADPSTVPSDLNRLRCWAPYRLTVYPGVSGVEAEYRPTWRLANGLGLHATLTPWAWHRPEPSPTVDPDFGVAGHVAPRTYWAVGGGLVWNRPQPIFTAVEVGYRAYRPYRAGLEDLTHGYVSALDLSGQFLLGRIQFGVRYFPDNWGRATERVSRQWGGPTTLNAGMPFALYVAMPDVPGLLYWFLPR